MKLRFAAVTTVGAVALSLAFAPVASADTEGLDYKILSPYENVDWDWNQYKSGFHYHTTESDGGNSAREMISTAYDLGFNVYAMTDHNVTNDSWVGTYKKGALKSGEEAKPNYYFTADEVQAMLDGEGRNGEPGLLGIPNSNEQSVKDHLNTFWADWNNTSDATLESKIAYNDAIENDGLDALSHINHAGRYYGGSNKKTGENGEDLGAIAATDASKVARYVDLFETYDGQSLVGMEIVNKVSDSDSYSDRILWDSILSETMPEVNVSGYSNDDAHSTGAIGYDYNMFLMPELSEQSVHDTMQSGAWYSTALVAKRELGADFKGDRTLPAPTISNIEVDENADSITITGADYNTIEWVADGKVIATGETLDLDDHAADIDNYVRAQLKGDNGISFTNAFGVTVDEESVATNNGRFLSDDEAALAALEAVDRTTADVNVQRDFGGKNKAFKVTITTADGVSTVRVQAETGEILAVN